MARTWESFDDWTEAERAAAGPIIQEVHDVRVSEAYRAYRESIEAQLGEPLDALMDAIDAFFRDTLDYAKEREPNPEYYQLVSDLTLAKLRIAQLRRQA